MGKRREEKRSEEKKREEKKREEKDLLFQLFMGWFLYVPYEDQTHNMGIY